MNLAAAALLGVVQGLTEFLPVSSSAHLILARAFFGWDADAAFGLAFDVACHVGTLTAVVAYFRTDLLAMARSIPKLFASAPGPDGRRIQLIVIGTIPVVLVGAFIWSDAIAAATRTPMVAAVALAAGAGLLFAIERVGTHGRDEDALRPGGAFAIGVAQAAALVPGVSRSGATIATGMAMGLRRDVAARFTFLMSIPAVVAAAAKEALDLRHVTIATGDLTVFAVGMVTSGVVGYLAVKYLIRYLASHRLDVFAWYRLALAAVTFMWLAAR